MILLQPCKYLIPTYMQLFSYAVIIYTISSPKQSLKMQYNFWQMAELE